MRALTALLVVSCISACDVVTVESPPGEPVAVKAEDWDGIWLHEEAAITVLVTDAEQGRLEAAWIEAKEGTLIREKVEGQVRKAGDWQFMSMEYVDDTGDEPEEPARYLFGRVIKDRDRVVLWTPSPSAFRQAVEDGTLPGRINDGEVILPAANDDLVERLVANGPVLFDWEQPMVFIRLQE